MTAKSGSHIRAGGSHHRHWRAIAVALAMGVGSISATEPAATNEAAKVLRSMSMEELMSVKVTTVSKKEERLSDAAAAVTAITQEDIRRSGVTTIPDALRLAPGVNVGRVDAHEWAVAVRGLNDTFTSSLLTLIDGRTIYTPLFAGTFWQANDVLLENIDRIEVIRGPGSTVWGANAFNGVVNVVTKPAAETQGLLVTEGNGSQQTVAAGLQYGGKLSDQTFYRVYGKFDDWDNSELWPSGEANDAWWKGQGGFRLDSQAAEFLRQSQATSRSTLGSRGVRARTWNWRSRDRIWLTARIASSTRATTRSRRLRFRGASLEPSPAISGVHAIGALIRHGRTIKRIEVPGVWLS